MDWLTLDLMKKINFDKMDEGSTKKALREKITREDISLQEKNSPYSVNTLSDLLRDKRIFKGFFTGVPIIIFDTALEKSNLNKTDAASMKNLYEKDNSTETEPKVEPEIEPKVEQLEDLDKYKIGETDGKSFYMNQGQREATDSLVSFIEDDSITGSDAVFMINGRGGTGKSTIIRKAIENAETGYDTIKYYAPTWKASKVLKEMTGKKVKTVASGLKLKPTYDNNGKQIGFEPDKNRRVIPTISTADIIIIDEGSMISEEIFNKILQIKSNSAKVIFMGDNVQFPPVESPMVNGVKQDSPVFRVQNRVRLTERMRQSSESPILPITDQYADAVEQNTQEEIQLDRTSQFDEESNTGLKYVRSGNFDEMIDMFLKDYKENPENTRIITYNNELEKNDHIADSSYSLNKRIREEIYGKKEATERRFFKNEIIYGLKATPPIPKRGERDEDGEPINVENGSEYKIDDLEEEKDHNMPYTFGLGHNKEIAVLKGVGGNNAKLTDIADNSPAGWFFLPSKSGMATIDAELVRLISAAKAKGSEGKKAEASKLWQQFYGLQEAYAKVTYAYAINGHKSQGSTYRNVYMMEDNILHSKSAARTARERSQAAYVGSSRAAKKLVIVSSKNEKNPKNIGNTEPEYQYESNMNLISGNEDVFDRILLKLQELYPNITAKQIKSIKDKNGKEAVGMALGMAIKYSNGAGLDTVPHEYAHIYINMLEQTKYMNNAIKHIMKLERLNREDAKEYLAERMGQDFAGREGAEKNNDIKYESLVKKLWRYIKEIFMKMDEKDVAEVDALINEIADNFYRGQNKESISTTPKKGYRKIDPETTFRNNPVGAEVLNRFQKVFPGSVLTGSVALSSQGNVYRTGTGDLHDLDMIMPKGSYVGTRNKFIKEFTNTTKIYSFYTDKIDKNGKKIKVPITTYIVPNEGEHVIGLKKENGRYGYVTEYKLVNKKTQEVVGTYTADIKKDHNGKSYIASENFGKGERAITVDLMFTHNDMSDRKYIEYESKELGRKVKMTTADSIFEAKRDIGDESPRDKDVMDYNLFHKDKIFQEPNAENNTQGSGLEGSTLFDQNQGDVEVASGAEIDLGKNGALRQMFDGFISEDATGFKQGFYSQEFLDLQNLMLDQMETAFDNGATGKITYTQFNTAVGNERETAGSIEHMSDRTAGINLRWNKHHGTARKGETFMHEIVHFMTRRAFALKPELRTILNSLKEEAVKNGVTYEIFLTDFAINGVNPTNSDILIAKDKFDYVFSKQADPEEFFAYAVTNEHVYNAIKNMKAAPEIINLLDVSGDKNIFTAFKKIFNAIIKAINGSWSAQAGAGGRSGAQIVTETMTELVSLQALMDTEETKIQTGDADTDGFINRLNSKMSPWTKKLDDKIEEFSDSVSRNDKVGKISKKLEDTVVLGRFIQSNLVQDIVTSVTQKTDNHKWSHLYELYRQGKNFTEKHRKGISDAIEVNIKKYFKEIDAGTRKAVSTIIFNLDIPSMIDEENGLDLENLRVVLGSQDNADALYENALKLVNEAYSEKDRSIVEGRFATKEAEAEADIKQAIALAKGLVDGGVHIENQQMNAENIYNKYYMSGKESYDNKVDEDRKTTDADIAAIKALDQLITSYGIKTAPSIDKKLIYDYLDVAKNRKNITSMINMYKTYVNDSVVDLYINNFNPIQKGFFDQQNAAKMSYDLVPEDELSYYIGKFGNMTEIGEYGTINGVKYFEISGRDHSVGFDEGMFSISGNTIPGLSLKSLLTQQVNSENSKKRKNDKVSIDRINQMVESQIVQMVENGGKDSSIVNGLSNQQFLPVYDAIGNIVDYHVNPTRQKKIKYMESDTDVVKSAAFTFSKMKHRQASVQHNSDAVDMLLKHHEEHVDDEEFVVIKKHEEGKFSEDIHGRWNRIPEYTRNYIFTKTGRHSIAIPKRMLTLITGEKGVTLSNFNFGPADLRGKKKTQKMILAFEDYIAEIWAWVKESIAIRMASVVDANTLSNMMQAWVYEGINPIEYMKRSRRKWQELNEYTDTLRELEEYRVELVGQGDSPQRQTQNKISMLETQLKKNPFHALVEDGQFSPIVEDVNINEDATGHIAKMIEAGFDKNKFTKSILPIKEFVFMDRNTKTYQTMMKITQYGDIITREIMREEHEEAAIKRGKPLTAEEKQDYFNFLDQLFVNYGYIDNRFIRYAERIFGMRFTKYLLRQAKAMHSVATQVPARLGTMLSVEQLTGIDLTTADDDYWRFFDAMGSRLNFDNPMDMLMGENIPILNLVPSISDIWKPIP
jgi:exodeoxyribonuclease-5